MRIMVNSIPKSGTHLVARLMDLLELTQHTPSLNGALIRKTDINPLARLIKGFRKSTENAARGLPLDLDVPGNWVKKNWLARYIQRIPDHHYVTAHLPYYAELSDFLADQGLIQVFIYRDPRDILISYINFQLARADYPFHERFLNSSEMQRIDYVLNGLREGEVVLAPLRARLSRAVGWIHDKNTLAISFEDLIGSLGDGDPAKQLETIRKVASWCNINISESELYKLADNIYYMKSETYHKGKIGQWKDFLDDEVYDLLMRDCGGIIKEYGYSLHENISR